MTKSLPGIHVTRNAKPAFHGCHRRPIEVSGRIDLPKEWRVAPELYLIPNRSETCLLALPPRLFLAVPQRMVGLVKPRELLVFRRIYFSSARLVKADSLGRIIIPAEFRKRLDLFGRLSLIGTGEAFEVWQPERLALQRSAP